MANSYNPGSLQKFTVVITNFDGSKSLDITSMVINMSVTEDIFKNTLYGSVIIKDAVGLLEGMPDSNNSNAFPIVGEEFINVIYQPYNQDLITLRFFVYSIGEITYGKTGRAREYTLNFCSEEHVIDGTTLVSKAYSGLNSDTFKSILTDFLYIDKSDNPYKGKAKKIINVNQPTRGTQNVIIPNLSPIQAGQFLARRSIAADTYNSATYLFFENLKGFNFCDVEYMIAQGVKKFTSFGAYTTSTDYHPMLYRFEDPITAQKVLKDPRRINNTVLTMNQIHFFDTIEKIKRGMMESSTIVLDYVKGYYNATRFRYIDTFEKNNTSQVGLGNESSNGYPTNSNSFLQFVTSSDDNSSKYSRFFIVPKDTSGPDTYLDTIYPNRASYFTNLAQNMFTIDTYGNTKVNAGDVIYVGIPSQTTTKNNTFISGYYLVCTIKHIFTQNYYHTKMDIYKNAFDTQLTSLTSSNAMTSNTSTGNTSS